jgi:mediator of RNA polymerase II transcription subunit 5
MFNSSLVGRSLMTRWSILIYTTDTRSVSTSECTSFNTDLYLKGDLQTTADHLILASFDVLANAVFRNEGPKSGQLLRSYLINKVPLLLASFASSSTIYPFNPEYCITQALNQVDTAIFPTLSGMFDISNTHNAFTETVRQDFFFACLLHGLVSETARDKILGDITFQELPDGGRYVKEDLIQQCLADPERLQKLIGEIDGMEGNAGAVCQALVDVGVSLLSSRSLPAEFVR